MHYHSEQTRLSLLRMQSAVEMYGRDCRVVRWAYIYRRLRNKIWWQYRRQFLSLFTKGPVQDNRLHVFWHLRGGVGDVAAARLAVLAMRQQLPHAVFYYHADSAQACSAVFVQDEKNIFLPSGEPLWYKYDIAFELCQSFQLVHIKQKRVEVLAPDFLPILEKIQQRQKDFSFFLKDSYLLEDLLGQWMWNQGLKRLDLHSYLSGLDFDVEATPALPAGLIHQEILKKYNLSGKKYITLHDGIDAGFQLNGARALKCWSIENWRDLARLIKAAYPDFLLVQLGGKNSPKFDFADICLVGKTALADLPSLLNSSSLHIDGESGLVQLSRYLQNKCLVLFGPTDKPYFQISKNINVKENACQSCMWLFGPQWHTQCVLGHETCLNMKALTSSHVFQFVKDVLK
ncbi:MAG: hypothetical protein IKL48_05215 [Elusimicrobiaceae bacterium]|nr:hypothetical protein [Elusimicrobiaceae bacterium]